MWPRSTGANRRGCSTSTLRFAHLTMEITVRRMVRRRPPRLHVPDSRDLMSDPHQQLSPGHTSPRCPRCGYDLGLAPTKGDITCPECGLKFNERQVRQWRFRCGLILMGHAAVLVSVLCAVLLTWNTGLEWLFVTANLYCWYVGFVAIAFATCTVVHWVTRCVRRDLLDAAPWWMASGCILEAIVFVGAASVLAWLRSLTGA